MTPQHPLGGALRKVAEEANQKHPTGTAFLSARGCFRNVFNPPKVLSLLSELEAVKGERFFTALLLECARRAERDANYNAEASSFWQRQHIEVSAALASLKEERDEARRQLRDALAVRDAALNAEAEAEQALSVLKGEMDSSRNQSGRGSTGAGEGRCSDSETPSKSEGEP